MDPLNEQLAKLRLINNCPLSPKLGSSAPSISPSKFKEIPSSEKSPINEVSPKKIGPAIPPKPNKKNNFQLPESDASNKNLNIKTGPSNAMASEPSISMLQRKQSSFVDHHIYSNKVTLDNPDILEQQLEALEHHKKQLQKKGLLQKNNIIPKLSSASFLNENSSVSGSKINNTLKKTNDLPVLKGSVYSNTQPGILDASSNQIVRQEKNDLKNLYINSNHKQKAEHFAAEEDNLPPEKNFVYSNAIFDGKVDDLPPPPLEISTAVNFKNSLEYNMACSVADEEIPPPPSPVSSSYSELRRATDIFPKLPSYSMSACSNNDLEKIKKDSNLLNSHTGVQNSEISMSGGPQQIYMNMVFQNNDYNTYESQSSQGSFGQSLDYYGYGSSSQGSSTYESIYEPINPRPPSQLSARSNYIPYTPYVNSLQVSAADGIGICDGVGVDMESNACLNIIPHLENGASKNCENMQIHKETEVEALTDLLVHSMDPGNNVDSFGICVACNERVIGENSGCTAMDQVYHIACFTCSQCQINLQGKPFYALDCKPYCEVDYLNTLEKCSVCMKPILERILRATGKPYHPQCFTCVVCGNSLDGIPFTVDAINQNYCIADFHKKFAPRCCVCKHPIMPEHGQEETVRVVALDRSFHFECYKCEDCGLLLSSEAEGRGCYPLDDHVLCKSCNAKRVQTLTNRMTKDL